MEDCILKNKDIRQEVKKSNIKLWQIADRLGIADTNFSKMLRKELSEKQKEKIRYIIKKLGKMDEYGK